LAWKSTCTLARRANKASRHQPGSRITKIPAARLVLQWSSYSVAQAKTFRRDDGCRRECAALHAEDEILAAGASLARSDILPSRSPKLSDCGSQAERLRVAR
jgi:hypothetical protein